MQRILSDAGRAHDADGAQRAIALLQDPQFPRVEHGLRRPPRRLAGRAVKTRDGRFRGGTHRERRRWRGATAGARGGRRKRHALPWASLGERGQGRAQARCSDAGCTPSSRLSVLVVVYNHGSEDSHESSNVRESGWGCILLHHAIDDGYGVDTPIEWLLCELYHLGRWGCSLYPPDASLRRCRNRNNNLRRVDFHRPNSRVSRSAQRHVNCNRGCDSLSIQWRVDCPVDGLVRNRIPSHMLLLRR